MWIDAGDSNGTGSNLSLADVDLPSAVGDGFARLYGSDDRPATAAEWVTDMREVIERTRGRSPRVDDLCTVDDGDHAFIGPDGEQTYICVLDPLVYPFLTGESGAVRSTTPVRGTEITFEMGADGPTVSHDDALVSIGVSDDVDQHDEITVEAVYREVCGYVQTFEDADEYETWAAEVDATTAALPADEGVLIARGLADALFDADGSADVDGSADPVGDAGADGETGDDEVGDCCLDSAC